MPSDELPQQPAALTAEQALRQAIGHHQAGQWQDAERLYRAILRVQPNHPVGNHNLGVLAVQAKQPMAGLPYLKAALESNPNQGQYWLSYIDALIQTGQIDVARQVLVQGRQRGLHGEALEALAGRLEAGARIAEQSRAVSQQTFEEPASVLSTDTPNSGIESRIKPAKQDRLAGKSGTPREKDPSAQETDTLVALFTEGRYAEAATLAETLTMRLPLHGFGWKALGAVLSRMGRSEDALAPLQKAAELMPRDAEAHFNLGVDLHDLGRLHDAVASYRRALEIKPEYPAAHNNLGMTLKDLGQLENAVASCRRALEINPDYAKAHSNLLLTQTYLPDQPAAMMLVEARRFGELAARQARRHTNWSNLPEPARCLRVGLVSGDLRNHAVGYFVKGMLAALASDARGRLELLAYSSHFLTDKVTSEIKACCHGWHSAVGLSDEALARRIRDDGIDILIDLSGHTVHNRLPLFAWKPAPVQASWLGYWATTGVADIDYLIADPWTLPETEEGNFTEKIWRLPETRLCFTVPDEDVRVSALPALANGHVTFGCFNYLAKMNDAVVALWARILLAVPGSRLFLKANQLGEAMVRRSVVARFAAHAIDADRLILEGGSPRAEYLAAYRRVDIALDPFPFPGGTTSAEGLWMGVPVLTLTGERFLSRQGVGLLINAGLREWIAADTDDYVARAVSHAGDLQRLAALRNGLRQQVLASPIFDAPRFARHLEAALRGMWTQWCNRQQRQL